MTDHKLISTWTTLSEKRENCLCIGLDPDIKKLPSGYSQTIEGLMHFCCDIIDFSHDQCIAYKPNISFFEAYGIEGLKALEKVIAHAKGTVPIILDAKRGDIGNTSAMQATYIFDYFGADATTLHPYMGYDSLEPFFKYKDAYHFVLGLTSNPGSNDFETLPLQSTQTVAEHVIETLSKWNTLHHNIGVVVGGTGSKLASVRKLNDSLLFLIPGVGSQGGTYAAALKEGKNRNNLALINASRHIMYASPEKASLKKAVKKAIKTLVDPV